jgi:shikimate dehydrogenase
VATLRAIGVSDIRVLNRTRTRAAALADGFPGASAWSLHAAAEALKGVGVIINATSAEIGGDGIALDFTAVAPGAVAMDMLYRPLETRFLAKARFCGLSTVDGLDMLIGQAIPSFEAFFGAPPPSSVDARGLLLSAMEAQR